MCTLRKAQGGAAQALGSAVLHPRQSLHSRPSTVPGATRQTQGTALPSVSRVPWVLPFVSQFHPDRLGSLALEAFVAKFLNPCFSVMSVRSRNFPEFSNVFGWLAACLPARHLCLVLCVPLTFNGPLGTLDTVCSVPCAEPFS